MGYKHTRGVYRGLAIGSLSVHPGNSHCVAVMVKGGEDRGRGQRQESFRGTLAGGQALVIQTRIT